MTTDFELPKDAKKSAAKSVASTPVKISDDEGKSDSAEKKPEPKFSKEELLQVFDDLIFAGTYSETVTIRGKLKIAFRTRTAEELEAITQEIDSTQANLISTVMEKRNLMNLMYALTSYQGKNLSTLKIEEKTKFVNALAAPIVGILMVALSKFDEKVYEAGKEGEENF